MSERRLVGEAQSRMARAVATMSDAARIPLRMRARRGSRNNGAKVAPASSHSAQITTIITASRATFAAASAAELSARRVLANTAAIATQAFGFATPSRAPPASEGERVVSVRAGSGGAVATWYASQRIYAADIPSR